MQLLSLVEITQVQESPNPPFCDFFFDVPPNITIYFMIPRFVLSAVLLVLALTQTLKQSIQMYKATKQWQPNQYMKLFVRDGIIYFFMYVNCSLLFICLLGIHPITQGQEG